MAFSRVNNQDLEVSIPSSTQKSIKKKKFTTNFITKFLTRNVISVELIM